MSLSRDVAMRVAISSAVLDAIIAEADLDHGREVCGLLFGAQETILESNYPVYDCLVEVERAMVEAL